MRALVTSFGSTGDVEPMLALAAELRRAGHGVRVAMPPNFEARVKELGFEYAAVGNAVDQQTIRRVGAAMIATGSRSEHTRHFLEAIGPGIPLMFRQLLAASAGMDVIVSTPFQLAARMVHDTMAIPFASIHLSHFGNLGGREVRDVSAPIINEHRASEGLAPLRDPLGADSFSPQLALFAISSAVVQRNARWPAHHHVTGYFFLDADDYQPPAELAEYLAAGEPPVVIGFGSMVHDDPVRLGRVVLEAVERVGRRAIIQRGWTGLAPERLPSSVHLAGFTPHAWLFPRASCVVHHGGAGTTAAAFRAGVPAVVVPHTLEQPIWAEFARSLGAAVSVIHYAQLTAEALANGLQQTLASAPCREGAAALGQRIRGEPGVVRARELIEDLVRRRA